MTGLGPVSSIGIGIGAFTESLFDGRSGISHITSFDPGLYHPRTNGGEVRGFWPGRLLRRIDPQRWGLAAQFAAAAARLAVTDGKLPLHDIPPDRIGVVMGTTAGESQALQAFVQHVVDHGFAAAPQAADLLRQLPTERLAHAVSTELAVSGESLTLGTACSASNYTLGYAYDLLADGEADVMLAGGADTVSRYIHAGFFRLGALARTACAPFDRDREGLLVGEGASMLLMETLDHARARGARIHAEVLGYGLNCDAHHPVAPLSSAIASCIRLAHRNSDVTADDIDYICTHGTGTPTNDVTETTALHEVFGPKIPPASSIKSMLGHTMGAASGFGAIASVLALTHGRLPPTINHRTPDPDLDGMDPVPNTARPAQVRIVQNNGFAFGGNNAITILGALT
ncbi:beta-ketoacyl-[acyl-carrier-protein] synthase family protein [Streptomyces sp. 8N616]|uniref:beta-ketoacyl-[acyl-carrier-protein] synthase family protein n=1 Tax=Streptomyces sp. 8N616 TaxID=3457414 RepID=UPI003FCF3487